MCLSLYLNNSLCYLNVCDWLQVCLSDCGLSIELIGSSLAARGLEAGSSAVLVGAPLPVCLFVCEMCF